MQNVAKHAFAELVERASACDRIRGVLALIKRHENLFRLPTRIRQATERGLYDQVPVLLCTFLWMNASTFISGKADLGNASLA